MWYFISTLIFYIYLNAIVCVWRSGDNLWESVVSFYHTGLRDRARFVAVETNTFIHGAILMALYVYILWEGNPIFSSAYQTWDFAFQKTWFSSIFSAQLPRVANYFINIDNHRKFCFAMRNLQRVLRLVKELSWVSTPMLACRPCFELENSLLKIKNKDWT